MYNFCLGLPMFFVVIAYLLKRPKGLSMREAAILSVLVTLTYYSHIVPLVIAVLAGGVLLLGRWWNEAHLSKRWYRAALRHFGPPAMALLPAAILAAIFLSGRPNRPGFTIGLGDRLIQLAACYSLVSYNRWEAVLSIAVAVMFGAVAVYLLRRRPEAPPGYLLLAAAAGCTIVYLFAPNNSGDGTHITERVLLLVYFTFLLWFGAYSFPPSARRALQSAAAAISLLMLVQHVIDYRRLNTYLDEYLSVSAFVRPNTTIFPMIYSYKGESSGGGELSRRILPFANLSSWIAAGRGVIDLHNYEAWTGEFPLRFRDDLNPALHLSKTILTHPLRVNFMGYPPASAGEVTYVVVWSTRNHELEPRSQSFLNQLRQSYDLIETSRPNGYARLYRLRSAR